MITNINQLPDDTFMKIALVFALTAYIGRGQRFERCLHPSSMIHAMAGGVIRGSEPRLAPEVGLEVLQRLVLIDVLEFAVDPNPRPSDAPLYFRPGRLGRVMAEAFADDPDFPKLRAELVEKYNRLHPDEAAVPPHELASAEAAMRELLGRMSRPS